MLTWFSSITFYILFLPKSFLKWIHSIVLKVKHALRDHMSILALYWQKKFFQQRLNWRKSTLLLSMNGTAIPLIIKSQVKEFSLFVIVLPMILFLNVKSKNGKMGFLKAQSKWEKLTSFPAKKLLIIKLKKFIHMKVNLKIWKNMEKDLTLFKNFIQAER